MNSRVRWASVIEQRETGDVTTHVRARLRRVRYRCHRARGAVAYSLERLAVVIDPRGGGTVTHCRTRRVHGSWL